MINYNLFKERNKNGKLYYYVQFYNEIGQRQTKKSVEILRKKLGIPERHHITKSSEASYIVQQAIENGLNDNGAKTDPLFADYLQEFWNFDISAYVAKRNKMRSGSLGRDYCYNRLLDVKNHIIPNLPKGLKCSQVKKSHIEKAQEKIIKDSSVSVWVNCSRAIFTPIKELLRKGILFRNPLLDLDKYTVSNVSTVGTLTAREIEKLVLQMFQDVHAGRTYKKMVQDLQNQISF